MPETDIPLKLLVQDFASDFAAWLLDVDITEVYDVRPLKVELPADAVRSDTVFHVVLASGQRTLLHVEFQGRRSEQPMSLRMLDYISRLVQREQAEDKGEARWPSVCSAVLYVGEGAGAHDMGHYEITCPDGEVTLAWRYRVIRLWEMRAEELLTLERPALLALIGQTRITEPAKVLPKVLQTLERVDNEQQRARLLIALTSLMQDEEILTMAERMVEAMDHGLLMDTPFLRRIREEGREEGREEAEVALRESILDIVAARFDPPASHYRRIEAHLAQVRDFARLRALLQDAIQVDELADLERELSI